MNNYDSIFQEAKNWADFIYFKEVIYPIAVLILLSLILITLIKSDNKPQNKINNQPENSNIYETFSEKLVSYSPEKIFKIIIILFFLAYILWLVFKYVIPLL